MINFDDHGWAWILFDEKHNALCQSPDYRTRRNDMIGTIRIARQHILPNPSNGRFEVIWGKENGKHWWQLIGGNGVPIVESSKAYRRKADADKCLKACQKLLPTADLLTLNSP